MINDADSAFLRQAGELAFQCPPTKTAFCVGCVIARTEGDIIATGYSREWGESWHAEEVALAKAKKGGEDLSAATLYSSLEPCSPRLSGKKSCADHIIDSGIRRVVFCLKEPPIFVQCKGAETLEKAGIEVLQDLAVKPLVIKANPHIPG